MALETNLRRGAFFAIASGAVFAVMGAFIKVASRELPNETVVFLRNLFGLFLLTPWLLRMRLEALRTTRLGGHTLRAGFGLTSMYCFFYGIAHLPLAEAMLLTYSMPLFIPFIAWIWLGERPPASVYSAVIIGFAGVALILKPGSELFSMAGVIGLCSGMTAAVAMTNIRRISDTEPAMRIVFYFALFATLVSAVPMLWIWHPPSQHAVLLMLVAGICATTGQLMLTRAYSLAPAARIGSLVYSAVVFSALLGWALWDERPDRYSVIGTLLIISAGMLANMNRVQAVEADVVP